MTEESKLNLSICRLQNYTWCSGNFAVIFHQFGLTGLMRIHLKAKSLVNRKPKSIFIPHWFFDWVNLSVWKVHRHNRVGYDGLLMSQHNSKMNNKQIGKGFFLTISPFHCCHCSSWINLQWHPDLANGLYKII